MSIENVKQFMDTAKVTPAIRNQLAAIPKGGGQFTVNEITRVAARAGFEFTAQDYEEAVDQVLVAKHTAGALDDAELTLISGGMMCVSSDGTHCLCCPNPTPNPGTSHP